MNLFYDEIPENIDEAISENLDKLYTYRCKHDLRFAFRGTDIPSILIGVYKNSLSISWIDKNGKIFNYNLSSIKFRKI